jgi:hypothetical protein
MRVHLRPRVVDLVISISVHAHMYTYLFMHYIDRMYGPVHDIATAFLSKLE